MSLLKSKVFILLATLVFLLLIATVGYKVFSLYAFNSFSGKLDTENQNLFTLFKKEVDTTNKISQSILKAVDFDNFSKETNSKYLNQAKTDYDNSLKDYKTGIDELKSKSSDIAGFSKMPLWLGSDQKKFSSDVTASLDQYRQAREADYQFAVKSKPIFNGMLQVIGDTLGLLDFTFSATQAAPSSPEELAQTFNTNLPKISSLEKYTKADYKFEEQDSLASEFPNSFKTLTAIKDIYGSIYLSYKAAAAGDFSQIEKLDEVSGQFEQSLGSIGNPEQEIGEKSKPSLSKIKDAYVNYAKALDFFSEKGLWSNLLSKKKVLAQNNQNKLIVLAYAVELYSIDHQNYPDAASVSSLSNTLKDGGYLDTSLKLGGSDFTYALGGTSSCELSYKDEISGQQNKLLVGVEEKTLGVSTQTLPPDVNGIKIDLSFVNTFASYFRSLRLMP